GVGGEGGGVGGVGAGKGTGAAVGSGGRRRVRAVIVGPGPAAVKETSGRTARTGGNPAGRLPPPSHGRRTRHRVHQQIRPRPPSLFFEFLLYTIGNPALDYSST